MFPRRRIARSGKVSFRRAITSRRRGPHEGFDIWARKGARGNFRELPRPVSGAQASAGRARNRKRRFGLLHGYMLADKGLPTCFVYAGRFPLRRRRGQNPVRRGAGEKEMRRCLFRYSLSKLSGLTIRTSAVVCRGLTRTAPTEHRPAEEGMPPCLPRHSPGKSGAV